MEHNIALNKLQDIFPIPHNIRPVILPAPTLSIISLLNFRVPSATAPTELLDRPDIFSGKASIITSSAHARMLLSLRIPALYQLEKVYQRVIQAGNGGQNSFLFPIEKEDEDGGRVVTDFHLPFWVFTYWVEARLVLGAKRQWQRVVDWLQSHLSYPTAVEGFTLLRTLTWGQVLPIDMGPGGSPLSLTRFAHDTWLSEDNMDQLARVLEADFQASSILNTDILPFNALHKIMTIYRSEVDRAAYSSLRKIPHVTTPGNAIASGSLRTLCISVPIRIGAHGVSLAEDSDERRANHWAATVIQTDPAAFWYADPMGYAPPSELIDVLTWWLAHYHNGPFPLRSMACTHQPVNDTSSCGLLSANALRHFCYSGTPLLDPKAPQEARISALVAVMKLIQKKVSQ